MSELQVLELADQAARQRFINETGVNFCVNAGAGAGKTTAITQRIASLAANRAADPRLLSKLVVVTYTVLAAEELRTRTRQEILQRVTGPGASLTYQGASAHGRQELLRDLRGAFFGTIHGFCLKLIREFGGRLGLPGAPELLEDQLLDREWERFAQSGALDDLVVRADLLRHLSYSDLLRLARGLATTAPLSPSALPASEDPYPAPPNLSGLDPSIISHSGSRASAERDCEAFQTWLEELKVPGAFAPLPVPSCGSDKFLAPYNASLAELRGWISRHARAIAASMAERFRQHRLARGRLTYSDQIQCARRLLDDPEILREMRARDWRVVLDEAQDTDRAMFEILTEITRPLDAPLGEWPARGGGPQAGRFSFVGDDQQSIYGERANPADYRRYVDAFAEGRGGELLTFNVTMRCAVTVVDAVNRIFANGIKAQEHIEFRALKPRPDARQGAVWRLQIPGPPAEVTKVEPRFLHEAAHVGRWLQARGPAGFGAGRWSDLAVIAPRRKWLTSAAQMWTQDFQIPTRELSSNEIRLESPANSWPVALLHVLVDPWDRFELLGVLREIFAISDPELAAQHLSGGLSFWPEPPPASASLSPRLADALRCLHDLRHQMRQEGFSVAKLLDAVIQSTCLEARLLAVDYPCDSLAALRAQAFQAECAGISTRTWVRTLVASLSQPPAEISDSINAITFLTSQKAKGLEWPVILLLGFGRPIKKGGMNESFPRLAKTRSGDYIVQLHAEKESLDKTEARAANASEWQRYLYVTMTRARDYLVVPDSASLYVSKTSRSPRSDFAGLALWDEAKPPKEFADAPPSTQLPFPTDPTPEVVTPVVSFDAALLTAAAAISSGIPKARSPSHLGQPVDLVKANIEDLSLPFADPLNAEFTPLLGVGGKTYGTWWHHTLQQFPWAASPEAMNEFLNRSNLGFSADEPWRERAATELGLFVASPTRVQITAEGAIFQSEIPFAQAIAGDPPTWIEGILDLLVLRADGTAWILDWKTDRQQAGETSDALLARLKFHYAPQLNAYAEAIQAAGRTVTRSTIYSTALGAAIDC